MENIYIKLADWIGDGFNVSLATVVNTRGSAPQLPGSCAIFSKNGLIHGTVGGGSVEAETGKLAARENGETGIYTFNLANSISDKENPICGGIISILLDVCPQEDLPVFRTIRDSLESQTGGVLVTHFRKNAKPMITRSWITSQEDIKFSTIRNIALPVISGMLEAIDVASFKILELSEDEYLIMEPVTPSPKLIIAGAGHIGRSLSQIANFTGFDVTVIDDRPEYANNHNIPGSTIVIGEAGQVLRKMQFSSNSYIVIVTRGHKYDAEALRACIGKEVAYIGMIGSRSKTSAMKSEFLKNGWATQEQWSRIFTPIGLDISSRSVEEIAVSIIAQLISVKNSRHGKRISCPA